mmetsp:Transcript_142662/g.201806  ORF Transcript_142662/g.201806 Transcript_142662/m.201806 type:complete len:97 (-) Transcript_142662:25-315(-)
MFETTTKPELSVMQQPGARKNSELDCSMSSSKLSDESCSNSPTTSPTPSKNKLTARPSMPEKRQSMRLSLPDEPKETNWLLMVFDPEVKNINEEEW